MIIIVFGVWALGQDYLMASIKVLLAVSDVEIGAETETEFGLALVGYFEF